MDTVESEGFLVVGCLAVGQGISGARRLPFSPPGDLFDLIRTPRYHLSGMSTVRERASVRVSLGVRA